MDKFCKTLDVTYLDNLTSDEMKSLISNFMTSDIPSYMKRKIQVYLNNRYDKNYNIKYSQTTKTNAEDTFKSWNSALSGAPKNSILIGIGNVNKGAMIRIKKYNIYPQYREISILKNDDTIFDSYKQKIETLYNTQGDTSDWLDLNATPTEDSIGDNGELVEFIDFGNNNNFTKLLNDEQRDLLMSKKHSFDEISAYFSKDGKPSKRSTLIMLKSFWRLETIFEIGSSTRYINLYDGSYSDTKDTKQCIKFKEVSFYPAKCTKVKKEELFQYFEIDDYHSKINKKLTPAAYKSILQKIIRFRPESIILPDGTNVEARKYLVFVFIALLYHKGALVPQIQRYVRGLESAAKRLGICILEDSYTNKFNIIVSLFSAAYISQKNKNWFPDKEICVLWINEMLEAYESNRYFEYSTDRYYDVKLSTKSSSLEIATYLLKEVKSFEGDINFVSYLAKNLHKVVEGYSKKPKSMPLYHAIDQHWIPNFIYYFDFDFLKTTSIDEIHTNTFVLVTGHNSRKKEDFQDQKYLKLVSEAQEKCINDLLLSDTKEDTKEEDTKVANMEFVLSNGILSSLVGGIKLSDNVMGSLDIYNPHEYSFCKIPKRGDNYKVKDPLEKEEELKEILNNGVSLDKSVLFRSFFLHKKLYLKDNHYFVDDGPLESALKIRASVDIDMKLIKSIFDNYNPKYRMKALQYLSIYDRDISFESFGRHNKLDKIFLLNAGGYKILEEVSKAYPYILRKTEVTKFRIEDILSIRYILSELKNPDIFESDKWGLLQDVKERKLWDHQTYSLDQMIATKNKGKFLFLSVGMGKTLIVMSYLKYLQERNELSKYIIYTCPSSAIESITSEIESFGFSTNQCIPLKSKGNKNRLLKYHVNIIEHDHLRRMDDELYDKITESFLIVDEVHKCLSDSQRTSLTLDLAFASTQFIVLTGTPIIDDKIYKLVKWLKLICDFEVNKDTFWVAINSMIHSSTKTDVKVVRKIVHVKMKDSRYIELVKPKLGGNNTNMTYDNLKEALKICYDTCTKKMIKLAKKYMSDGVLLVAKDNEHQDYLYDKLKNIAKTIRITKDTSINLTDKTVEDKTTEDYKIVITTIRKSEGYNCTRLGCIITSVYPSNNATRIQMEGRINRIGQSRKKVYIRIVSTGILNYILTHHENARSIDQALRSMI